MAYPKLTDKPGAIATAAAIRRGDYSAAEAVDAAVTRIELEAHDFPVCPLRLSRARRLRIAGAVWLGWRT